MKIFIGILVISALAISSLYYFGFQLEVDKPGEVPTEILIQIKESSYYTENEKGDSLLNLVVNEVKRLEPNTHYQVTLCASKRISYSRIKTAIESLRSNGYNPSLCSQ